MLTCAMAGMAVSKVHAGGKSAASVVRAHERARERASERAEARTMRVAIVVSERVDVAKLRETKQATERFGVHHKLEKKPPRTKRVLMYFMGFRRSKHP